MPAKEKADPKAFERMTDFARKIVAVPKSELPKPAKPRKKHKKR